MVQGIRFSAVAVALFLTTAAASRSGSNGRWEGKTSAEEEESHDLA
jgi:hypothetical protein